MKLAYGFSALALTASMTTACAEFKTVRNVEGYTVHKGITAETLDDTPGTVTSAIIYAPYRYKSGTDTIAEVTAGSERACFTQMFDAAAVNPGNYRVNCIGPKGDIVARFSLEAEPMIKQSESPDKNEIVRETWLEVESRRLPVTPSPGK